MGAGFFKTLLKRLLFAVAALLALPAAAQGFPPGAQCHAGARADENYAAVAASPARWTCGARD